MQVLRGHTKRLNAIAFSADGRNLVSCGTDRTIRIWDTASGEGRVLTQQAAGIFSDLDHVAFTADGRHVVTRSIAGGVQAWDVSDGKLVATLIAGGNAVYRGGLAVSHASGLVAGSEWVPEPFE